MAKKTITERDVSYHQAQAGIAARELAASQGGDPAQVRALVHAAQDIAHGILGPLLKGRPMRADDLLVTLCLNLHADAFGADPRAQLVASGAEAMRGIAALAFIFTATDDAFNLLDAATDAAATAEARQASKALFKAECLALAGDFGPAEVGILTAHLRRLSGHTAPLEADAETQPGEP